MFYLERVEVRFTDLQAMTKGRTTSAMTNGDKFAFESHHWTEGGEEQILVEGAGGIDTSDLTLDPSKRCGSIAKNKD